MSLNLGDLDMASSKFKGGLVRLSKLVPVVLPEISSIVKSKVNTFLPIEITAGLSCIELQDSFP